jgi:serine/threonine protein kinase/WD40 repeat protein
MTTIAATVTDVDHVFQIALAARERGEALDLLAACGGDECVRGEVESLLRHLDEAGDEDDGIERADAAPTGVCGPCQLRPFLDPAEIHGYRRPGHADRRGGLLGDWDATAVGQRVGGFMLIGQIGAGAMGVVFLAEQSQPRRTVALKLLRRAAATPSMIRRFEREGHLLARLNHPGIAQVYASGVAEIRTNDGSTVRAPYIAMELVEGPTILEYVSARPRQPALALELVTQICDALGHAHQRGVIHRDLKPANILVSSRPDDRPQVKVLDFGVARGADDPLRVEAADRVTTYGQLIGTLAYMSPEQLRSSVDIDTRCDVYTIGAVTYQLLSGRLPVDVSGCALPEAARRLAEDAPERLGAFDRSLRGDVETIVAKAMEKDPARRYQSAAELSLDIRRHLAHEPIEARRDSLMYLLSKQASRYRSMAFAAGVLLAVMVAFAAYAGRQQRVQADIARAAKRAEGDADAARGRADATSARLADELSASRIAQGRLLGASGDLSGAERLLWDEWFTHPRSLAAMSSLLELYWRSGCLLTIPAHTGDCRALAMMADGRRIVTSGDDSFLRIWSIPDGAKLGEFDTGLGGVRAVGVAPDGSRIVAACERGSVEVERDTGARRVLGPQHVGGYGADFASNGLAAAIGSDDGTVRLLEPATAAVLLELHVTPAGTKTAALRAVRFDHSCNHLAAVDADGQVMLWHVELGAGRATATPGPPIAAFQGASGFGLGFSPDDSLLGTGAADGNLRICRVSDGSVVCTCVTRNGAARSAAFSPDGSRVAVTGYWRTQLFDVQSGQVVPQVGPCLGAGGGYGAAFTPDGRYLVVTGTAGTCRVWDLRADPTTLFPSTNAPVVDLSVARVSDQFWLASVQSDGELRLRVMQVDELPRGDVGVRWHELLGRNVGGRPQCVALAPDGALAWVGRTDGRLLTVRTADGRVLQDLPAHAGAVNAARRAPGGQLLVTGGADGSARVWLRDGEGWKPGPALPCDGEVIGVAVSRDGGVAVTTSARHSLRFWSLPDGRLLRHVETASVPWKVAFSEEADWLGVSAWDGSIDVWDARSLAGPAKNADAVRLALELMGHAQSINGLAFASSDLLASASSDDTMRVWNLGQVAADPKGAPAIDSRRCLATLDAHAGDACSVTFLPGRHGRWVAVGYLDGTVRVWDLAYFNAYMRGQSEYQRKLRGLPAQ